MYLWEIQIGCRARRRFPKAESEKQEVVVIEAYPVHGIYHDFVRCRTNGHRLYFLPEELVPASPEPEEK